MNRILARDMKGVYTPAVEHGKGLRFVIGDVHGCVDPLRTLLDLLTERYGSTCGPVFFVGDLVDRGPDSAATVQLVLEGAIQGRFRCVLGNHDEMLLQNLLLFRPDLIIAAGLDPDEQEPLVRAYRWAPQRVLKHWLNQGGETTVASYGGVYSKPETWDIPPEHIAFLASLPLAIRDHDLVVTHAWAEAEAIDTALKHGADPWNIPPDQREILLWNRDPPSHAPSGLHISGHTARKSPLVADGAIGIDTGCCFGNRLTAYTPEEHVFLQLPCN